MSFVRKLLSLSFFTLTLGCSVDNEEEKFSNKPLLKPEQMTCLENLAMRKLEQSARFTELSIKAMENNMPDIPLVLAARRANEALCMAEVMCYGNQELMLKSAIFNSCLKEMEQ
jgi:hypothetical protein